ncbi:MAG TPA: allantoate amidohydrolase [Jatrophihabitans sp.]|jgi:allantoate deiminase
MSSALERCNELATITAVPGRIDRFHLTPEHKRANELVGSWMEQAGLRSWVDAAGNVCGRREGATPGLPALLLGSHLDTVPDAGKYDGPLGVVLGIEVASRLRNVDLPFALEVIGFADEEGTRFGVTMLGSKAVAGTWEASYLDAHDADGVSVREAMLAFGLDPEGVSGAARRDLAGYLEAHIEQGAELQDAGLALGVVTSICGARRFSLTVLGEARHAGGTPFVRRKDALIGASHIVLEVERIARGRGIVATVGRLEVSPGAVNVIPGKVDLSVDLRAGTDGDRDAAWDEIRASITQHCAGRGLQLSIREEHTAKAALCSPRLQEAVAAGISATGRNDVARLYSWAGHDGMVLEPITDIGMLFIRCHDGISHHPDEAVRAEDVELAAHAFTQAVRSLAVR